MKLSKFNIITEYEDKVLIYNYLSTSFVALEKEIFTYIENKKQTEYDNTLLKANILIDEDVDEDTVLADFISRSHKNSENAFNEVIVLTTTACNARCYYCYEHNLKPVSLDKITADKIVDFIIDNYKVNYNEQLTIRWFGGEPLVNADAIDYICQKLNERNIRFVSKMISNGSLFSEDIVTRAKSLWNLNSLQITLDGVGDEYDKIKNYKQVSGSAFAKVIDNIQLLQDSKIKVLIRINYSVDNIGRAKSIISYLDSRFPNKKYIGVYCAALREEDKPAISTFGNDSPQLKLIEYLFEHKFIHNLDRLLPRIKAFPCEAWLPKRYFIYPNGDIYKCQHTMSDNEYKAIGNVSQKEFDTGQLKQWNAFPIPLKCKDCKVWNLCKGGCKSVREQGKFVDSECYQYKNSLDGLLKLYYKLYKEVNRDGNSTLS